jgi:hypothetical protein
MTTEFFQLKTKRAKVAFVREKLASDERWLTRGLVAIYKQQTANERQARQTIEHNKVGFTAVDADFLSGMATLVLRDFKLTFNQKRVVLSKMQKYSKQLVELAIAKHEQTSKDPK